MIAVTIKGGPQSKPLSRIIINRIKAANEDRFFIGFEYEMSKRISQVCIKYSV